MCAQVFLTKNNSGLCFGTQGQIKHPDFAIVGVLPTITRIRKHLFIAFFTPPSCSQFEYCD